MTIAEKHKIQRQGKQYVLFAGLLNEAHQRGLKSIETELIQIPSTENGNVAICQAVVELEDGRRFGGIGDASPTNVTKNIGPHIIRMSETRAKARSLRDALNIEGDPVEDGFSSDDGGVTYPEPAPSPLSALRGGAVAPPQDEDEEEEKDRIVDECLDIAEQLPDAANVDADVVRASAERSLAYAKAARQRLYIKAEEYGVEVS